MARLLTIVWVIAVVLTMSVPNFAGTYGGGSGIPEDPFQISTAEQLNSIGLHPEDWDKCFTLMVDIDLPDPINPQNDPNNIKTIGKSENQAFTGIFDGNNHVIRNIHCTNVGLFRYVGGKGRINRLGMVNPEYVSGSNFFKGAVAGKLMGSCVINGCWIEGGHVTGGGNVGGLVGFNSSGTIINCHSSAVISGNNYVGGIVGYNNSGGIKFCYSTGSVTGTSYVGGLIGWNASGVITSSYATGKVTGTSLYAGGLLGYNGGPVTFCYSLGPVTGYRFVGGLIATNYGDLTSCYSQSTVTASEEEVGGLVGENGSGTTIISCYATGDVHGESYMVGGLVGGNHGGSIQFCHATGAITGTGNSVGGLVGMMAGVCYACYSSGAVTGNEGCVGGLVGQQVEATITSCYATGKVSDTGQGPAGGLVGGVSKGTIINCYSTGLVAANDYYVGLIGNNDQGTITASFWDVESSGQTRSDGGIGKTTAEMTAQATFTSAGWDFLAPPTDMVGDWVMPVSGYPKLRWQVYPFVVVPDLSGLTETEARSRLIAAGIVPGISISVFDPSIAVGLVSGTYPPLGTIVQPDTSPVNLLIAKVSKYSGGEGTEAEPWQIESYMDYVYLVETPADHNKRFIVTKDIDFAGVTLSPMGTYNTPFTGIFDGNGHILRNVNVVSQESYIGLFGSLRSGGQIKNLGIEDANIKGHDHIGVLVGWNDGTITSCFATGAVTGDEKVGGLVGTNDGGAITSCYATCTVNGSVNVGGLVGQNGWMKGGTITSCYASSMVSGNPAGGLVGYNGVSGYISSCYATGTVNSSSCGGGLVGKNDQGMITACYAAAVVIGTSSYCGGLVGNNNTGAVNSSFWDVEISGKASFTGGVGLSTAQMKTMLIYQNAGWEGKGWIMNDGVDYPRLVWENTAGIAIPSPSPISLAGSGTEVDPYLIYTAEEFASLSFYPSIFDKKIALMTDLDLGSEALYPIGNGLGAFTGVFDGQGHILRNVVINQPNSDHVGLFGMVSTGSQVKNLGLVDADIRGHQYVGGLVGSNWGGTITSCYTKGTVTGSGNNIGGLVGYDQGGPMTSCYSTGTVNGGSYVGGLCGYSYAMISQCYTTCAVIGTGDYVGGLCGYTYVIESIIRECFATGSVTGRSYIGGLVGENHCLITLCYATGSVSGSTYVGGLVGQAGAVSFCYATGFVSGTGDHVGGLVGSGSDTAQGTFWDIDTSGQTSSPGGLGLTTKQMQESFYYSINNWGGTTWTLPEGSYPRLAWEQAGGEYISDPVVTMMGIGTEEDPWLVATEDDLVLISEGIYFWDKHFRLVANLDVSGMSLKQIGRGEYVRFTGSFDGDGHTISNLIILMPNAVYVGLFSYINTGSVVKNLGLTNVNIQGGSWVGGITGLNHGTISSCYVTGSVKGSTNVGGLCGQKWADITQSYFTGEVVGTGDNVGGLVGNDQKGTITSCYAIGAISGRSWVGGIVGTGIGKIISSYSNITVTGSGDSVGGIGGTGSNITSCYALGIVSSKGSNVGGLAGTGGTVTSSHADVSVNGSSNVGGLLGKTSGNINYCYALGEVGGGSYVGGLIGYATGSSTKISFCYATGSVTGKSQYVGGLLGSGSGTTTSCYATGSVIGTSSVGGLMGRANGTVNSCYAMGTVSGSSSVGGLIGNRSGTVTSCFWDLDTSGQIVSAGGTGKTTAEMKSLSTFIDASWDFVGESTNGTTDTWRMCANGVDYPRLSWEYSQNGDFDCPNGVALDDLLYFSNRWLATTPETIGSADLTSDGKIKISDLAILSQNWLK